MATATTATTATTAKKTTTTRTRKAAAPLAALAKAAAKGAPQTGTEASAEPTKPAAKKRAQKRTSARSQAAQAKPKAQPEPKRPAKAPDAECERIAAELKRIKLGLGVPMRIISEQVGLTSSQVGRSERGGCYASEVASYEAFFARVASGEITPPVKARRTEPGVKLREALVRMEQMADLVRKARDERAAKARTALLDEALDLLTNTTSGAN